MAQEPQEETAGEDTPAPKKLLRSCTTHHGHRPTNQDFHKPHVLPVECIICKGTKYVREHSTGKRKVEKLVLSQTKDGGYLLDAALLKQDEKMLLNIRGKDLVAIEVRYHKSCYYRYTKVVRTCMSSANNLDSQPAAIYEKSYTSFCKKIIEGRIMKNKEILRLTKTQPTTD